jgi:CHAD domain-containing protein
MAKAKEIENLDCNAEALSGIRLVLHTRFGEMYERRAEALDWTDIEGVHDMRVASRRLRSAIKDFRDYLGGKKSLPRRGLKEVADALGDVRDQDVAIVALEKMRAEAAEAAEANAEDVAAGIGHLIDERNAVRQAARVKLAFIIAERPLADLKNNFLSRLVKVGDDAVERARDGKRGRRTAKAVSFGQAGREVIAARVVELKKLSNSLHHPFDSEPLHDMRIAAKRLRYAMELFAPCWGGKLTSYAHEVSELQTSLGELRDCDTWLDDLGARLDRNRSRFADAWTGAAGKGEHIRRASVWLLSHFTKERSKHFRNALDRWEEWETNGFFAQMKCVLNQTQEQQQSTGTGATVNQALTDDATVNQEHAYTRQSR